MKKKRLTGLNGSIILSAALILSAGAFSISSDAASSTRTKTAGPSRPPMKMSVDASFNAATLNKVDGIVRKHLYSQSLAEAIWPGALNRHKEEILKSKNLHELSRAMNKPIAQLKSSHCQFVTANDETYWFLHSLFASFNDEMRLPPSEFTGFVTGKPGYGENQIRYVLDGSPAEQAGLKRGDKILLVDGAPYIGESNFFNKAKRKVQLTVEKNGRKETISITPIRKQAFDGYVEATSKSARTVKKDGLTLGYLHIWCGGSDAHDAMEEALGKPLLQATDGLILDLRDGYGGNSFDDIDFFFRPKDAFPDFIMVARDGKKRGSANSYDKPVVVLINEGVRSGKELMAYGLQKGRRACLTGKTTAGAVLAGRLFPINERASLYLAVADGYIGGKRLEGKGVSPDEEVTNEPTGEDRQYERALEKLIELVKFRRTND